MNTKPVPIIIVLTASAVACVISILQRVEFGVFFYRLLITVLVFAVIGVVAKMALDAVFSPKARAEDMEVAKANTEAGGEEEEREEIENIEDDSIRDGDSNEEIREEAS